MGTDSSATTRSNRCDRMNRIFSVVRSMTEKIIELSRGVAALTYGDIGEHTYVSESDRMELRGNPPVVQIVTTGRLSTPWRHRFKYRLVPDSKVVFEEAYGRIATRPATNKRALIEARVVHAQ